MQTWTEEDLKAFTRVIDPEDDATGGGTASAVAAAMAAGLAGMVARVSIGKEGLEDEAFYREIDAEARDLTATLMRGGREDSEAFGRVMASYRLPKGTETEKQVRSAAIQEAMEQATRVPLENARRAAMALELCRRLEDRSNPNAASDLEVGLALARVALGGCLANVRINLDSLRDEETKRRLAEEAEKIRKIEQNASGGERSDG